MNKLTTLLVCLWSAHAWGASPTAACASLWSELPELKQSDQPLFSVPSVPSEGVLPTLTMSTLSHRDGTPFILRSSEESNCVLDRIFDQATRDGILDGAKRAARDRAAKDLEAKLEALEREIDMALRRAAGLPEAA